jgi:hypothetical protein
MSDLPLNGRSYANLATIQAGVIADFHTGSNIERGGQAFVALGPKISINGARPNQAMYLLDGTEISTACGTTIFRAAWRVSCWEWKQSESLPF